MPRRVSSWHQTNWIILYLYIYYSNVSHLVRRIIDAEDDHKKLKKMLLCFFIFCWFLGMRPISCPPSPPISLLPPPPPTFSSNQGQRAQPLFFVPGQINRKNHLQMTRIRRQKSKEQRSPLYEQSEKMKKRINEWRNYFNIHSLTHSLNQWITGMDDWTDEWMDCRKNR